MHNISLQCILLSFLIYSTGSKSNNPLSPDYVPSIFKHVPSPEKRRKRIQLENFNRRQDSKRQRREQIKKALAVEGLLDLSCSSAPVTTSTNSSMCTDHPQVTENSTLNVPLETDKNPLQYSPPPEVITVDTTACNNEQCREYIKSLENECQALRTENIILKDTIKKTSIDQKGLENNDKKVNTLTGIPSFTLLITLFNVITNCLKTRSDLSPFQQYMMTLMRLRMNFSFEFLAFYFNVDPTTASKLFKHCINVIYCKLVPSLVTWPDREVLRLSLPYAFRNAKFCNTVCIIDCFEIFMEKPRNLLANAQCYSSYKSHCTQKYLIGICPQGSISFISNGWGGRTSDKHITENSGFLTKLLPGDLVLADRGFDVTDSVNSCQAELKIPAFTRGKKQLDPVDLENTRGLASVRIHIERVIGVLRQKYTLLQSTVPISLIDIECKNDVTYLDKIVKVCCALTNVGESVVPFQ